MGLDRALCATYRTLSSFYRSAHIPHTINSFMPQLVISENIFIYMYTCMFSMFYRIDSLDESEIVTNEREREREEEGKNMVLCKY